MKPERLSALYAFTEPVAMVAPSVLSLAYEKATTAMAATAAQGWPSAGGDRSSSNAASACFQDCLSESVTS